MWPSRFSNRARMLSLVLLLPAAGCSTANYAAPIKGFKAAADNAATSYAEMNDALAEATLNYAIEAAAKDPASNKLQRPEAECGAFIPGRDVRCRAFFSMSSPDVPEVKLQREAYTDPLGNLLGVLTAVQDYAGDLAMVQEATTAAEVNASLDSIQADLTKLLAAANGGQPDPLPQAAGQLVKWAFGQYVESVKFNALQNATAAAREPLAQAQVAVQAMEESAKVMLASTTEARAREAMRNLDSGNPASIRAALQAQNAYDDLLTAPLSPMFDNLVAAHGELADALESGSHLSVRNALVHFEEIQKQAATLQKIAKDLKAAIQASS